MVERIALAVWKKRISPLFDASRTLFIIDIQAGQPLNREIILLKSYDPVSRAKELEDKNINFLICGAISITLAKAIESKNIHIIPFTAGDVESVICSYIDGSLANSDYRMPGCHKKVET